MKTVYLLHGFNVRDDGKATIDRLNPYFARKGWRVIDVDYHWTGLLGVRMCVKKIAKAMASMVEPGSVAVGHSNGCAIIHYAAEYGAPFSKVAYINPALNSDTELSKQVRECHVWHSPSDKVVNIAKWLPFHFWGSMGADGYTGKDERYINHDKKNGYEVSSSTHSDIFHLTKLAFFAPRIVRELEPDVE